ncbi:MAG: oligosaccharide flippase family protein [Pseudomonadota bacterium]
MSNTVPAFFTRQMARFMGQDAIAKLLKNSAQASAWVGMSLAARAVIRLASNFIMARLLMPEAFGLVAVAFSIQFLLSTFTDIGLNGSVVRSDRGNDPAFLRTVWVTQVARNVMMAVVIWVIAAVLAVNHDKVPEESIWALDIAPAFIAVAAIQAIVTAFESPSIMFAQRNLDMKRLVVMEIVTRFSAIPMMVVAAMMGAGAWALLVGSIGSMLLRTLGSHYWLRGPAMAFEFNRDCFNEIFNFGKWLVIAGIAGFVIGRGDQLIFGSVFDARTFSLYMIAGVWIKVLNDSVRGIIFKICFPAIAQCRRRDPKSVPRVYKRFRLLADAFAMGSFLVMVVGADLLFTLFYKDAFEPAKEFVPFIAFLLLSSPLIMINAVILTGGDSQAFMYVRVVGAVALAIGVPLIYQTLGMMPAVLAFSLSWLVNLPVSLWALSKQIKIDWWTESRILIFGALAAVALFTFG